MRQLTRVLFFEKMLAGLGVGLRLLGGQTGTSFWTKLPVDIRRMISIYGGETSLSTAPRVSCSLPTNPPEHVLGSGRNGKPDWQIYS